MDSLAESTIDRVGSPYHPSAPTNRGYVVKEQQRPQRFSEFVRPQSEVSQTATQGDSVSTENKKSNMSGSTTEDQIVTTKSNLDIIAGGYLNTSAIAAKFNNLSKLNNMNNVHSVDVNISESKLLRE